MNLFTREPEPGESELEIIRSVLAKSSPPITLEEIREKRTTTNRAAAWRGVVSWVLNRQHGIPQATVAGWLGDVGHLTIHRAIRKVDAVVASTKPKDKVARELILSFAKKEGASA